MFGRLVAAVLVAVAPAALVAQDRSTHAGHSGWATASAGAEVGQAAFAAIAEVVRMLDADPTTDWSRVDIEALRRHLVSMDRVLLESRVRQRAIPGGLVIEVTGAGEVEASVREMLPAHAETLAAEMDADVVPTPIAGGIRLTITVRTPGDARAIARMRGLGFAGLLVIGSHHAPHHLALARGDAAMGHRRPN
jgi:hypothetical protein